MNSKSTETQICFRFVHGIGFVIWLACQSSAVRAVEATPPPVDLRCEYLANPLGIDEQHPRLGWKLQVKDPKQRGVRQTAYQVLVASSLEALAQDRSDLWDSGKVETERSIQIEYAGRPLASEMYWLLES